MDLTTKKHELAKEFFPTVQSLSNKTKVWMGFLVVVILIGLVALFIQVRDGHVVTGMRDYTVWGIYIINFIFFVTISYSGAFMGGVMHFYNSPWKNAVSRIIEIVTMLSLIVGPIFILLCIGRLDRLHYLFLYPRVQSPITWDIIAIMTDLVGCILYLYLTFIPDFAILRDHSKDNPLVSNWRKKVYKFLAMNYQDTDEQRKIHHRIVRTMSAMIIALAIVAYSVLAWIFSLTLQPGWNSTIFAPYFIVAGLYSGAGVIIIAMYLMRKIFHLERYIRKTHFVGAGIVLMIFGIMFGYFTFSEYFPRWFSHKTMDSHFLNNMFTNYFWEFIFANYIGVLFPFLILLFKKLRTIKFITFAGFLAVLCLWINRYIIVVPTLESPYLPVQDARPEYVHYSATWVEWALTFAGFAGFALLFTLILRLVPVIPMSGIIEREREKMEKLSKKNLTV